MKKKIFVFVVFSIIFAVLCHYTAGFTYTNGTINLMITEWVWIAVTVFTCTYWMITPVKNKCKKAKIIPFRY